MSVKRASAGASTAITRTVSWRMVAQEEATSCGIACVRQLLRDLNVQETEAAVRDASGTGAGATTEYSHLVKALNGLLAAHGRSERFKGGGVVPDRHWNALIRRAPFLAIVGDKRNAHWVIVDGEDELDRVLVRDPAPESLGDKSGFDVVFTFQSFSDAWLLSGYNAVFRDP